MIDEKKLFLVVYNIEIHTVLTCMEREEYDEEHLSEREIICWEIS